MMLPPPCCPSLLPASLVAPVVEHPAEVGVHLGGLHAVPVILAEVLVGQLLQKPVQQYGGTGRAAVRQYGERPLRKQKLMSS